MPNLGRPMWWYYCKKCVVCSTLHYALCRPFMFSMACWSWVIEFHVGFTLLPSQCFILQSTFHRMGSCGTSSFLAADIGSSCCLRYGCTSLSSTNLYAALSAARTAVTQSAVPGLSCITSSASFSVAQQRPLELTRMAGWTNPFSLTSPLHKTTTTTPPIHFITTTPAKWTNARASP